MYIHLLLTLEVGDEDVMQTYKKHGAVIWLFGKYTSSHTLVRLWCLSSYQYCEGFWPDLMQILIAILRNRMTIVMDPMYAFERKPYTCCDEDRA